MKVSLKEITGRSKTMKMLESYAICFLDEEKDKILSSQSFSDKVTESFKLLSSISWEDIPEEIVNREDFHDVRMYLCKITSKLIYNER